jgi:hypothetical protein
MQLSTYLWLYSPCGPRPRFQFLNPYKVGRTPWTEYLHTEQHKYRINAHRHPCVGPLGHWSAAICRQYNRNVNVERRGGPWRRNTERRLGAVRFICSYTTCEPSLTVSTLIKLLYMFVRFELSSGNQLSWGFSWLFSVPPAKYRATAVSFLFSIQLSSY